jgi:PKD repeat protein
VNIIDSSGCMETTSFNIIEPSQSQVSYNYTTSDLLVYFTNTSTVGANSWEFGDGTTSSSNSPFHTYSSNGTYNACLNLTTNCGTISYCSDIIVFDSSSVGNEKISNNLLEIYPNPTSEKVSISTGPYTGPINANVYDLFGRKIFTTNLKELSLKSFANGVYILVVKIGDNTYTTKIIKE